MPLGIPFNAHRNALSSHMSVGPTIRTSGLTFPTLLHSRADLRNVQFPAGRTICPGEPNRYVLC